MIRAASQFFEERYSLSFLRARLDENSLFRSVMDQLRRLSDPLTTYYSFNDLRQRVVRHVVDNEEVYQKLMASERKKIGEYVFKMMRYGMPGGLTEITALSRIFNVNIFVLSIKKDIEVYYRNKDLERSIYLGCEQGYYHSLTKLPSFRIDPFKSRLKDLPIDDWKQNGVPEPRPKL